MYAFGFDSPILNIFSYPQGAVKKLAFFYSPFFVDISMFFGVTNQLLARLRVFSGQLLAHFWVFSEPLFARLRVFLKQLFAHLQFDKNIFSVLRRVIQWKKPNEKQKTDAEQKSAV